MLLLPPPFSGRIEFTAPGRGDMDEDPHGTNAVRLRVSLRNDAAAP